MISWLQITSGRGPEECCWVVARVMEQILNEASIKEFKTHVLEIIPYDTIPNIFKSALIAVEGDDILDFVLQWEGSIQWIGKSIYRPNHKRKNWFVGVNSFSPPQENELNLSDVKFESMRSSGAGGQHVNKTESAVRVTHIATGLIAVAQEERSQHLNRKLALSRLYDKLRQEKDDKRQKHRREIWDQHNKLERGNPVRVYEGTDFKLKKKTSEL